MDDFRGRFGHLRQQSIINNPSSILLGDMIPQALCGINPNLDGKGQRPARQRNSKSSNAR
jgi:hypothetical protein